jgi:hypothetical protein
MALERTPLPEAELPEGLAPFFGAEVPAGKVLMLARGMAPSLSAPDLVTGLYQASVHEHEKIREAATRSAEELPDNILEGALQAPLHPLVLDFYAEVCRGRRAHLERILFNRQTADETFVRLARSLGHDDLLEIIAKNEERLLRHPPIIEALYLNQHTRMSTANRCVELAVRNQLELDIPAYKEIARALGTEPRYEDPGDQELAEAAADAAFTQAVSKGDQEEPTEQELESEREQLRKKTSMVGMTISQKIRLAMIGTSYHRSLLLRDPNRVVAMAAIKSPLVKENEVVRLTQSSSVNDDVIRYIATNRDWLKLYQVKVGLLRNPKTPLPTSLRLLPHMRVGDLRNLARSRNIPSALKQAAQQMLKRKG